MKLKMKISVYAAILGFIIVLAIFLLTYLTT